MDVVFAVDASEQVTDKIMNQMREFLLASTDAYSVSPSETHVGLVQFSDNGKTVLRLDRGVNVDAVKAAVSQLQRQGGSRRTDNALRYIDNDVLSSSGGSRFGADKVLVILTTGKTSLDGASEVSRMAGNLKSSGVQIIVVGLGKDVDPTEIDTIASGGNKVIVVDDGGDLPFVLGDLEKQLGKLKGK